MGITIQFRPLNLDNICPSVEEIWHYFIVWNAIEDAPIWSGFGSRFVEFKLSLDLSWNWPVLPCLMVLLNSRCYSSRDSGVLCVWTIQIGDNLR